LSSLCHPKLPKYVEHFEQDGALYLVMEKIEGTPLSSFRQRGPMSERDAMRLLADSSEVLHYLHGRTPPVIHRDLKPSNVIRRPDGSYAFVDFGAVRDRLRPEGGSTVVGTFGYMAPEQLQGRAGPGTDVYAIGATVIASMTATEPENLPHRGLSIDVDAAIGAKVSRRLRRALTSMLEPDPDRRPTRISDALSEIGASPTIDDPWLSIREQVEAKVRDSLDRRSRSAQRKAERRMRKLQRRQRKLQAREWKRHGNWAAIPNREGHPPPVVRLAILLALTMAQVSVTIAVVVFIPMLLTLLSLFFGRQQLRSASTRARQAGQRAVQALDHAHRLLSGDSSTVSNQVRVEAEPHVAGTRISDTPSIDDGDDGEDFEGISSSDSEGRSSHRDATRR
jgi:serine/threonine protein kinase